MNDQEKTEKYEIGDIILPEEFRELVREARRKMEEMASQKNVKFYRAYLKADKMIYAYEGDKQILLKMLGKEAEELGFEILAFTLLDDELQLLVCRCGDSGENGSNRELIRVLQSQYRSYYQDKHKDQSGLFREDAGWKRIRKDDVLRSCDEIHQLPVKERYVSNARDFWWSSQNSYCGKYAWHFLNIWRVMSSISRDPLEAVQIYRNRNNS